MPNDTWHTIYYVTESAAIFIRTETCELIGQHSSYKEGTSIVLCYFVVVVPPVVVIIISRRSQKSSVSIVVKSTSLSLG